MSVSLSVSKSGCMASLMLGRLFGTYVEGMGMTGSMPDFFLLSASLCSKIAWLTWFLNAPSCQAWMSLARKGMPYAVQCAVTSSIV